MDCYTNKVVIYLAFQIYQNLNCITLIFLVSILLLLLLYFLILIIIISSIFKTKGLDFSRS